MDDRDEPDLGVIRQETVDVGRVDGLVVGHLELVQLGAEAREPVAHALAEDAGDEIEHGHPGPDERARGGLEPEHGLALHEQHVLLRPEQLADLLLGASERFEERGVVVVGDRRGLRGEHLGRRHRRPGAEREGGFVHWSSFQRAPRTYGSASAGGR
jgi:hypothetical protein